MKDYNKWNLKRLVCLFAALAVVVVSVVTVCVSIRWWWASLPTAGAAVATAVALFWFGVVKPNQEDNV